jgi:hypothetical protein
MTWHCEPCKKSFRDATREKHLQTKTHALAVSRASRRQARTSPARTSTSAIENTAALTSSTRRASPASVGSDRDAIVPFTARWHCDVCDKDLKASSKAAHLKSKRHHSFASVATNETHRGLEDTITARSSESSSSSAARCLVCRSYKTDKHLKSSAHESRLYGTINRAIRDSDIEKFRELYTQDYLVDTAVFSHALDHAVLEGREEIVRYLVEQDPSAITPFTLAIRAQLYAFTATSHPQLKCPA